MTWRVSLSFRPLEERIKDFEARIEADGREFCLELFEHATVRLMAHKYAYYILSTEFIKDIAYDGEEKSWFVMGRALGLLKEDETSPCVDFDPHHPKAEAGVAMALAFHP
jgi:hypothetical protein